MTLAPLAAFRARLLLLGLALSIGSVATASAQSTWMRYPAISPDGTAIVFSCRGDLWIVPVEGGDARVLTTHADYERSPVWSPDSKTIAFASDRHGNFDVFVISRHGGAARRVTFHSANDTPTAFTPDGKDILFSSSRLDAPQAPIFHSVLSELYAIPIEGGSPRQVLTTPAEKASYSPDGSALIYHDLKGYEDQWRKHHVSSIPRDIWSYDPASGQHVKLTAFRGEDREPVWRGDSKGIFFLSERDGSFNVYAMELTQPERAQALTRHTVHPCRFLSISNDGLLCYTQGGHIYTVRPGNNPSRVPVRIFSGLKTNDTTRSVLSSGATEMAVSPDEKEIAFVIRGEIFVTSVDYATTKRVTDTATQERSVAWGNDGRSLYYCGERDGSWNLYKTVITREDEKTFSESTLLTEEAVLVSADESLQPLMSPDGKKLAYLHNRDEIRLLDLETKKSSPLVPARWNYSYSDGDISFDWSPDNRWLSFTYRAHKRFTVDVGIVNIATGEMTNITESGYSESSPLWSSDKKAMLFTSDRMGRRNHGSWGSDSDIFAFYLNRDHWEWANLDKEDLERRKKRKKDEAKKDSGKKEDPNKTADKKGNDEAKQDDSEEAMDIDLDGIQHRVKRLTLHSGPLGGFDISPDGETLVYFAQVDGSWDLWKCELRSRSTSKIPGAGGSSPGSVTFAKDGKNLFVLSGGRISKIGLSGGPKPVAYQAEMNIDGPGERAYIFDHAWRQVKRKFYVEDLHGVDWEGMKEHYGSFLGSINNNHDFAELMSEMLGELNASHTGCRYRPRGRSGDSTPTLGLLYDTSHRGQGLKVAEVLKRGPADLPDSKIGPGVLITHIDGVRLTPSVNPFGLLNNKSGKRVRLGLTDPESNKDWEEVIEPASGGLEGRLLYQRWIDSRRARVQELSNGRLGYVHVQGMNDPSFRRVYLHTLGRESDKEALIVDTRFNGGGWLHDDLVKFLHGEDYIWFTPRGKNKGDLGAEPAFRWTRPVVVLQSESNYSDAHMFPFAFKELGLGKLIGTPVPGTGTAVWWETQIDRSLVFGIPQLGMLTKDGKYLENLELDPDVLVYNTPDSVARGEDLQLQKAVEVLLQDLDG